MSAPETIEQAMHGLCIALHRNGIDPAEIEISLPSGAWWRLWTRLEQLYRMTIFDGRGAAPDTIRYMGVTFRVKR